MIVSKTGPLLLVLLGFVTGFQASSVRAEEVGSAGGGRAVLVTGASSGIGKVIATSLAEKGFYVYAGARKPTDMRALSAIPNIQGISLDVTVQSDIDAAVATVSQQGRGLYGLVNNAGVFLFDPLIEASERDLNFIIDVNVVGPFRVTKAFAPLIIKSRGRIMTTGSVAGLFSTSLLGPYAMTKHAMEAFTDSLAAEMAGFEVAVGIVEPGNFRSNIMKNMHQRIAGLDDGQAESLYAEDIHRFAGFAQGDRSHHAHAQPVADAVTDFMTADEPRFRYLVTPNQGEADFALVQMLQKVAQLNQGHSFTKTRDELVELLDTRLEVNAP